MENQIPTSNLLALQLSTEALQKDLDAQQRRIESSRSTARAILGSGSLIVALISAFQIVVPAAGKIPVETYRTLFILALVLYVVMILCCIVALWPARLASPAKPDGKDLYNELEGKSEEEARRTLLSAYREAEGRNRAPARRVRIWTTFAGLILPLVVIVLLVLGFNVP